MAGSPVFMIVQCFHNVFRIGWGKEVFRSLSVDKMTKYDEKSVLINCQKKCKTGDIIGFLYADDYYENNSLEYISRAVIENPNNDIYSYGLSIEDLGLLRYLLIIIQEIWVFQKFQVHIYKPP